MLDLVRAKLSSLDYNGLFKGIMEQATMPMSPLESLASSAVRTAHKVQAKLIAVLTRGGEHVAAGGQVPSRLTAQLVKRKSHL